MKALLVVLVCLSLCACSNKRVVIDGTDGYHIVAHEPNSSSYPINGFTNEDAVHAGDTVTAYKNYCFFGCWELVRK